MKILCKILAILVWLFAVFVALCCVVSAVSGEYAHTVSFLLNTMTCCLSGYVFWTVGD